MSMSWTEKLISLIHNGDIAQRAIDPATGQPFPKKEEPSLSLRTAAMLAKTPWAWRQMMKLAYLAAGAVSAWLAKAGANDDHSTAIVTGLLAAFAFAFEQLISWLCAKAKVAPPPFARPSPLGTQSFAEATAAPPPSPFALVATGPGERPSIFNAPQVPITPRQIAARAQVGIRQPEPEPVSEPESLTMLPTTSSTSTKPRRPIGEKGQKIIAEAKATNPQPVFRGTLRGECDDLVVIDTADGPKALQMSDFDFYLQACDGH